MNGAFEWVVAGIAIAAAIVGGIATRQTQPKGSTVLQRFIVATLLSFLAFAATLPAIPPFQPKSHLGFGLLLGALWLLVATAAALSQWRWFAPLLAFVPIVLVLFRFAGNPFPALFGLLIGTVLVWFCIGDLLQPFALPSIALVAAIGLARWHEPPVGIGNHLWQALPLCLAVAGWLAVGVQQAWQRYWQRPVNTLPMLTVASLLLLIGGTVMQRFSGDYRPIIVTVLTCGSAILFVLGRETVLGEAMPLLWIGLFVTAFASMDTERAPLMSGYGISLAALALTWLAKILDKEQGIWQGAVALTAFALFRLFAETYPLRTPRADLYTHYTFVGFLFGAVVPVLLARWREKQQSIIRSLTVGFWSAAMPMLLGALWGVKAVVGYLGGGIAAVLLSPVTATSPALFAGFATALPLTALVDPLSDLPRRIRFWFLLAAAAILLVTLSVEWLARQWTARKSEA